MHYKERRTLCISTQAGCAMGCVFCATGQMGFKRHLSSGEIVEQVLFYARQLNLAISLHAANDELRASLLPIDDKYPISELLLACKDYIATTNRRLTFEWALIQDVNDLPDHARELGSLLRGMLCHVNVIPLNPTRKYPGKATTHLRAEAFKAELERFGIPCTIRIRRGIDIHAGCGQLAVENAQ